MAQTYGVYDLEALPARTVATLAAGLPDDCRVKRRLAGVNNDNVHLLLAMICDRLDLLAWMHSENGRLGRNRPVPLAPRLAKAERETPRAADDAAEVFEDGDAFLTARAMAIMKGSETNG